MMSVEAPPGTEGTGRPSAYCEKKTVQKLCALGAHLAKFSVQYLGGYKLWTNNILPICF